MQAAVRQAPEEGEPADGVETPLEVKTSQLPTVRAGEDPTVRAGEDPTRPLQTGVTVAPATDAEQPDGILLGRYRLKKRLGSGAFGTVWSAHDERLERDVAVKILPRERVVPARFEREVRAAARLQHQAIVTLYEAAVDDDGAYLVSELVRGRTLDQLLDAGKLSDREIIEVCVALCDALEHAHAEGVIHRDVKPSNVLIATTRNQSRPAAKLTDFGVAHVVGDGTLTRTGDVIGTLAYMSPEQAEGREVDPSCDLYALAVVLYEALTGVNPLAARTSRRVAAYLPPLRRQRRDLPRALGAGIDRALRPRPAERGTIADLRRCLLETVPQADETRGVVVSGWRGETLEQHEQPADWDGRWRNRDPEPEEYDEPPRLRIGRGAADGPLTSRGPNAPWRPDWLPRALGAAASGPAAALLCTHLIRGAPVAPAAAGMLVAAAVLLFPRLGWLAAILLGVVSTAANGYDGAALVFAVVALGPALLQTFCKEGWALPPGAAVLGAVGLAGAWPGLVSRAVNGWLQRAIVAAAGFVWAVFLSLLMSRNLYWRPPGIPPAHSWATSPQTLYDQVIVPFVHGGGPAAAGAWAAAAVLLPLVQTRRWIGFDLVATVALSAAAAAAVQHSVGRDVHGLVLGAVTGGFIAGWPALTTLMRSIR